MDARAHIAAATASEHDAKRKSARIAAARGSLPPSGSIVASPPSRASRSLPLSSPAAAVAALATAPTSPISPPPLFSPLNSARIARVAVGVHASSVRTPQAAATTSAPPPPSPPRFAFDETTSDVARLNASVADAMSSLV